MAATLTGRRLTFAHKQAQTHLASLVTADMLTLWRLLDPARLNATAPKWLTAAVSLVEQRRSASAALAAGYLRLYRAAEAPTAGPFDPPALAPAPTAAITTSLAVTGPVAVRQRTDAGLDLTEAAAMSSQGSAAAGARHVLNAGRDLTIATLAADPAASAWERITSGSACDFCDSIAADGPFGFDADFPAHDNCGCTAEPVYAA